MPSIYDIKPKFQAALQPLVGRLAVIGVSANQVTLFACALSIATGILISLWIHSHLIFWLLPGVLFIRMALNAIDGMLAREHNMQSKLGAILNELTDMISDVALYLPLALLNHNNAIAIVAIVILTLLTEAAGLTALSIGAKRRYDGPMGKSDRAFVFGLIGLLLAMDIHTGSWLIYIWCLMILLLIATIFNRCKHALRDCS
ncbi:MAG: CDP-alcohol phosphatidyltransferase family protein [Gammaproteobacteria bacterium]|nr:CDP-alcohol phosphatidyltransferase family protein [Gammaproteobacteria bacterium]